MTGGYRTIPLVNSIVTIRVAQTCDSPHPGYTLFAPPSLGHILFCLPHRCDPGYAIDITQHHPVISDIFERSLTLPNTIQQYPTSPNNAQHGWPHQRNFYTQHCWHLLGKQVGLVWPGLYSWNPMRRMLVVSFVRWLCLPLPLKLLRPSFKTTIEYWRTRLFVLLMFLFIQ